MLRPGTGSRIEQAGCSADGGSAARDAGGYGRPRTSGPDSRRRGALVFAVFVRSGVRGSGCRNVTIALHRLGPQNAKIQQVMELLAAIGRLTGARFVEQSPLAKHSG